MRTLHYLKLIALTVLASHGLLVCMDQSSSQKKVTEQTLLQQKQAIIPFLNKICYADPSKRDVYLTFMAPTTDDEPRPTAVAFDYANLEIIIGYNNGKLEIRNYDDPTTKKGQSYYSGKTPIESLSVGPWKRSGVRNDPICVEQKNKDGATILQLWDPSHPDRTQAIPLATTLKNISFNEEKNSMDILDERNYCQRYKWTDQTKKWKKGGGISNSRVEFSPLENFEYSYTKDAEQLFPRCITITQCDGKGNTISIDPCPQQSIRKIIFSPDGTKLAIITENLFPKTTPETIQALLKIVPALAQFMNLNQWKVSINGVSQYIPITDNISIWDTRSGDLVTTFNRQPTVRAVKEQNITSLAFDSSNTQVTLLDKDGTLEFITLGDKNTIQASNWLCDQPDLYPLIAEGINATKAGTSHTMTDAEHTTFMTIPHDKHMFLVKNLKIRRTMTQSWSDFRKSFTAANIGAFMSKYKERFVAGAAAIVGSAALWRWWQLTHKK